MTANLPSSDSTRSGSPDRLLANDTILPPEPYDPQPTTNRMLGECNLVGPSLESPRTRVATPQPHVAGAAAPLAAARGGPTP